MEYRQRYSIIPLRRIKNAAAGEDTHGGTGELRQLASCSREEMLSQLKDLEVSFPTRWRPEYANLVNFSTREYHPIHRWYYYHEAFSPELVAGIIQSVPKPHRSGLVDPFCGGGTSLLVSAAMGLPSLGVEVNPFSCFVAKVKTRNYGPKDVSKIQRVVEEMKTISMERYTGPLPELSILPRLFDSQVLDALMTYRKYIDVIREEKIREFFFLGWLSILEGVSNYRKGGNGLKKRPRAEREKEVARKFLGHLNGMMADIQRLLEQGAYRDFMEPTLRCESALTLGDLSGSQEFSLSVFSPPYLNCFDYCEVYKIELWMGGFVDSYGQLKKLRQETLTSHLNGRRSGEGAVGSPELDAIVTYLREQSLWDRRIPDMVSSYFSEMEKVLSELWGALRPGALCVIVVGNSAYGNVVIPVDLLLAQAGEKAGFCCQEVVPARRNETSSQQHLKLGPSAHFLRESLVFLRRP